MHESTKAALWWASQGKPVFPCNAEKKPMTANGFYAATTDPAKVQKMFDHEEPALIGMPTGDASGIFVLDTDMPHGEQSLMDLQAEHDDLPRTFTIRTQGGGLHRWFKTWPGARSTAGKLGLQIDTRAEGGYAIIPGSQGYTVIDPSPIAEAPQWIRDEVTKKPKPPAQEIPPVDEDLDDATLDRGDAYARTVISYEVSLLDEMVRERKTNPNDYTGPPWDETTFRVACSLQEIVNSSWNRLTVDEVYSTFMDRAPQDAGWSEANNHEKWLAASRRVGAGGRPLPNFVSPQVDILEDAIRNGAKDSSSYPLIDGQGKVVSPDTFFAKGEGLIADALADAVMEMGPLAVEDNESRTTWKYVGGVWQYAPAEIRDRCVLILRNRFRMNHVSTVTPMVEVALVKAGQIIKHEPTERYINTRSGMLDWRTGQLVDHDPKFFSTVQLPLDWDPEATCPNFDKFLEQVMEPDAIPYIWEILGYLAMNGNPLQCAILFHGDGRNGKGTLLRVIGSMLGHVNTSAVTLDQITEGTFEVTSLVGKVANLAGDIDPTFMKSTAKFKAITGEDAITVQRKFQSPFRAQCWAVPVFSANKFWRSADTSEGYMRRWVLVSFPNRIKNPVPGLSDRLLAELPGILAKAARTLPTLMARSGGFEPPESALAIKREFESVADQVTEWLEEDPCVVEANFSDQSFWTGVMPAYQAYTFWAEQSGLRPVSAREFRQRIVNKGFEIRKVSTMRIYGLRVDRMAGQVHDMAVAS